MILKVIKAVVVGVISLGLEACSTPPAEYGPPSAQPRTAVAEPAGADTFSLDQDTPGGKFSSWMRHRLSANGHLSASITVTSPRPTDGWTPFVAVELCATKSCTDVGRLEIGFDPDGVAKLKVRNGAQVLGSRAIDGDFKIGRGIVVDLNWRGGEYLEARLNGAEAQRIDISFVPAAIRIVSGSADVAVTDIAIE